MMARKNSSAGTAGKTLAASNSNSGMAGKKAARRVAYDAVRAIHERQAFANLLVPDLLASRGIAGQSARFATNLVYGTIRQRGFLDAVISSAAHRPCEKIDASVLDVLRCGTFETLLMSTPSYAVSSAYVDIAKRRRMRFEAGFVNAVLRAISKRTLAQWQEKVCADACNETERLSIRYSHPQWIIRELERSLKATYGAADSEQLAAILERDNAPAPVTLALHGGEDVSAAAMAEQKRSVREALQAAHPGARIEDGVWSPCALRVAGVDIDAAVKSCVVGVEDEGSQLAALTLIQAADDWRGDTCGALPVKAVSAETISAGTDAQSSSQSRRWLDLCAAPGGKTALLAIAAAHRDARLTANEIHPQRAELVRQNLRFLRMRSPQTLEAITVRDGREYATDSEVGTFDVILVDAPCSGLGTLRRRPEARWRKCESDVRELVPLQKELLEAALAVLNPGGVIAYVTCSPVVEETRGVVDAVTAQHPQARRLDAAGTLHRICPSLPLPQTADGAVLPGDVQLFESPHDTDMMFISLITR